MIVRFTPSSFLLPTNQKKNSFKSSSFDKHHHNMNTEILSYFFKKTLNITTIGFAIVSGSHLLAQTSESEPAKDDASYKLSIRDQIDMTLYDEPELSNTQRIDGRGQIQIPLIGTTVLAGMTLREAENYIENLYIKNRILKNPKATIRILEYAPKEVSVLGAVALSGRLQFPEEVTSLDIIEVIARAGGFTEIAKTSAVRITRTDDKGQAISFTVDVERMIKGRSIRNGQSKRVPIYPGDIIYISERAF